MNKGQPKKEEREVRNAHLFASRPPFFGILFELTFLGPPHALREDVPYQGNVALIRTWKI